MLVFLIMILLLIFIYMNKKIITINYFLHIPTSLYLFNSPIEHNGCTTLLTVVLLEDQMQVQWVSGLFVN